MSLTQVVADAVEVGGNGTVLQITARLADYELETMPSDKQIRSALNGAVRKGSIRIIQSGNGHTPVVYGPRVTVETARRRPVASVWEYALRSME